MSNYTEFDSIRPFDDSEALSALSEVATSPFAAQVSRTLFPEKEEGYLSDLLRSQGSINDFQDNIMCPVIDRILSLTSEGLSVSGAENLKSTSEHCSLLMTNHRDIVLDPAIIQCTLHHNGLPYSELCVGNNLLENRIIENIMRSNRMITVKRGIASKELYDASMLLSSYIRKRVSDNESSVWIAQREGRTKNGLDSTGQVILKMLDLSGSGDFEKDFLSLHILPMSISYEYESCDLFKARELLIAKTRKYVKHPGEDTNSILTGIRQPKGHIHLSVGKVVSPDDIRSASLLKGNERYQHLKNAIDAQVRSLYKLWKTNYIACDLMEGTEKYLDRFYTLSERVDFEHYVESSLDKAEKELDRKELRRIFLEIYANPVYAKHL